MTTWTPIGGCNETPGETVLLLRTCGPQGESYGGFQWPLEVGAVVEALDWDPSPECGGGLHGLPRGEGDPSVLDWSNAAVWLAVEAGASDVVLFDGKAKARRVVVRAVGGRAEVTAYVTARYPDAQVVGGTVIAEDDGIAMVGDRGAATVGDCGTAIAGSFGAATAGDRGTAIAGDYGAATAGCHGTAMAGDGGTAMARYHGTATAGNFGAATAGSFGAAAAGDGGTATVGDGGTAIAGDEGTAIAGDEGTAIAGNGGAATVGCCGTATVGDGGTAAAGRHGVIAIRHWDGNQSRTVVGEVGENGIRACTPYRLDGDHHLVAVSRVPSRSRIMGSPVTLF